MLGFGEIGPKRRSPAQGWATHRKTDFFTSLRDFCAAGLHAFGTGLRQNKIALRRFRGTVPDWASTKYVYLRKFDFFAVGLRAPEAGASGSTAAFGEIGPKRRSPAQGGQIVDGCKRRLLWRAFPEVGGLSGKRQNPFSERLFWSNFGARGRRGSLSTKTSEAALELWSPTRLRKKHVSASAFVNQASHFSLYGLPGCGLCRAPGSGLPCMHVHASIERQSRLLLLVVGHGQVALQNVEAGMRRDRLDHAQRHALRAGRRQR